MTPQEKATELVEKFKPYVNGYVGSSMLTNTEYPESILRKAKECAIIAVDELIDVATFFYLYEEKEYWDKVKKELENL